MVKCLSYGLCYESWIKGRCHLYGDIDESFAWCELQMPERQEKPSHSISSKKVRYCRSTRPRILFEEPMRASSAIRAAGVVFVDSKRYSLSS